MRVHIVAEGPSDREIIKALIEALCPRSDMTFTPESKTQMKRRGAESILMDPRTFAKFLHHAYDQQADLIVVMVDNDGREKDGSGVSRERKERVSRNIRDFVGRTRDRYAHLSPNHAIMVPVESMDYWAHCVKLDTTDCAMVRDIESIDRHSIKAIAYGPENVFAGWVIDRGAVQEVIDIIGSDTSALRKLRCLPSFRDFEAQLPS